MNHKNITCYQHWYMNICIVRIIRHSMDLEKKLMILEIIKKFFVNVVDKIKHHVSLLIFLIGSYVIFILGISHHRLEVWLFYMIACIFIFFSRRNKIPMLLTAIFIAWPLSYFPLIITVQSAKHGPGIVTACGIDRALIGYENAKKYAYENSCVFLSDMSSGWYAKYYWVW